MSHLALVLLIVGTFVLILWIVRSVRAYLEDRDEKIAPFRNYYGYKYDRDLLGQSSWCADVLKTAPVEAVNPNGDTVDTAVVVEAPPVETAAVAQAPAPVASLPKTASDLPLIGLVGLLMLGGGFALFGLSKPKV